MTQQQSVLETQLHASIDANARLAASAAETAAAALARQDTSSVAPVVVDPIALFQQVGL